MRYRRTCVFTFVLLAFAAGCASFRRAGPPDSVIVFKNDSVDQADVYAIGSGGQPFRIGTVFAAHAEPLRVPQGLTASDARVNIIARIFATGRVVSSGPFSLAPGDTMVVTLSNDEKLLMVLAPNSSDALPLSQKKENAPSR